MQGCELRDLAVRAQFFVNPEVKVEKTASHLKIDASGHAYAAVSYPSILEIWPEVYKIPSIRVVEVRPFRGACLPTTNCCAGRNIVVDEVSPYMFTSPTPCHRMERCT